MGFVEIWLEIRRARSQVADAFARQTGLPKTYEILMTGLWYMDHLQFNVRGGTPIPIAMQ